MTLLSTAALAEIAAAQMQKSPQHRSARGSSQVILYSPGQGLHQSHRHFAFARSPAML
jgi:hypothetical protein